MEVHHHPIPHKAGEKKKFKEYFFEFLMLFFAVTLGFFAENIREHHSEKENARRFLETYRDELEQQRNIFATYKKTFQTKVINCDTIKSIFFRGEENKKLDVLQRLMIRSISLVDIPVNTSSYDQIVNSGALRYINNIALRDSMSAYKGMIETNRDYNLRMNQTLVNVTFDLSKLIDLHDVVSNDTSLSYDVTNHVPSIAPFAILSKEQRGSLVFFFESYIVQAQSDLRRIRRMDETNHTLIKMVNDQLNK